VANFNEINQCSCQTFDKFFYAMASSKWQTEKIEKSPTIMSLTSPGGKIHK
jgi:hypothetical protein